MHTVRHLTAADSRRVKWKNGRGITEELALWPSGSAFERNDFVWRISKAEIEESGPFSAFPGFDRILVVVQGAGLVLVHGEHGARARLRPFEPYRFAGDSPTTCELVNGPVFDLNVLVRIGSAHADVQVLRLGRRRARELLDAGHAFVHALEGRVSARVTREEEPFALRAGESVWIESSSEEEIDLVGGSDESVVIVVRIALETR